MLCNTTNDYVLAGLSGRVMNVPSKLQLGLTLPHLHRHPVVHPYQSL